MTPRDDRDHRPGWGRSRRTKNYVLLAILLAFVALVYLVSLVRMSGG